MADVYHNTTEHSSDDYADFIKEDNQKYSIQNKMKKVKPILRNPTESQNPSYNRYYRFSNLGYRFCIFRTVLPVLDEKEELSVNPNPNPIRPMSSFGGLIEENDGKHDWQMCMFKDPTFCLVCGKIISSLGGVPLDEENNVPLCAIKHGPLLDRTGYRFSSNSTGLL